MARSPRSGYQHGWVLVKALFWVAFFWLCPHLIEGARFPLEPLLKAVFVTQSYLTLCDPVDYSLPGSSVHGILQARILEWVIISFSRGSSPPRDQTWVPCTAYTQTSTHVYILFPHRPLQSAEESLTHTNCWTIIATLCVSSVGSRFKQRRVFVPRKHARQHPVLAWDRTIRCWS